MNNTLLSLYSFLKGNENVINKIEKLSEDNFVSNDEVILVFFGIFKGIVEKIVKVEELYLFKGDLLTYYKQILLIDKIVLNSYNMINGYALYDFFKVDCKKIYKKIENLVNLN